MTPDHTAELALIEASRIQRAALAFKPAGEPAMTAKRDLYVVIGKPNDCFVLNTLAPYNRAEADRSIRWQQVGPGQFDDYAVCRYDRESDTFVSIYSKQDYTPTRGCLTDAAWIRFRNSIGAPSASEAA